MATHDDVHAFADGELPPAQAADFRAHLAGCAQCQAELNDILQLTARSEPAPSAVEAPPPAQVRTLARRRAWVTVAGGAVAAALALVLLRPRPPSSPEWARHGSARWRRGSPTRARPATSPTTPCAAPPSARRCRWR